MDTIATEDKTDAQAITPEVITSAPAVRDRSHQAPKLPIKFRKFQKLYLTRPDLKPSQIAAMVYDCKNMETARVIASQNLRKLNISRVELLERMGLSDEDDALDLMRLRRAKKTISAVITGKDAGAADTDFIEVDDNPTQFKALELTYRIKGAFTDEKSAPDQINNFLTIVENVNVANIQAPNKGITIEREQSENFNKYLAK